MTGEQMDNNRRLKLIAGALRLERRDVARAVTLGGIETSNSRADGWLRATGSQKRKTGGAPPGQRERRDRVMTDAEFDAFCLGLRAIMEEVDNET